MAIIFQNKWILENYEKQFLLYGTRGGGGANSSLHPSFRKERGAPVALHPPLATGLLKTPSYPDKYCTEVTN